MRLANVLRQGIVRVLMERAFKFGAQGNVFVLNSTLISPRCFPISYFNLRHCGRPPPASCDTLDQSTSLIDCHRILLAYIHVRLGIHQLEIHIHQELSYTTKPTTTNRHRARRTLETMLLTTTTSNPQVHLLITTPPLGNELITN